MDVYRWKAGDNHHKQVNVVFRYDDYSARSSTDTELRIIDAFRKHESCLTVSVIPFICAGDVHDASSQDVVPLAPIKGDILRTAFKDGTLDMALHGYSHQTKNAAQMTEFKGLDYSGQLERLAKGKDLLESITDAPVTAFVPPWDSYDSNTLRALEQLGFSTISASRVGEATKDSRLNFLPATSDLSQLKDAVKAGRASSDTQPLIVVLFHDYDFKEIDEKHGRMTYRDFSDLLSWIESQDDVRLLSISRATKLIEDLSANRLVLNRRNHLLSGLLPPSLRAKESNLYLERPAVPKTLFKVGGFFLTILSLGIVLSFLVRVLVFPRSAFMMNMSLKGIMVSAGAVGTCVAVFLCLLYLKKKRLWDRRTMARKLPMIFRRFLCLLCAATGLLIPG